jgi:hypothetical protein
MAGFGDVAMLAASVVTTASLLACGGGGGASNDGFGPDPDFSTLDARLGAPTGTMSTPEVGAAVRVLEAMQSPELAIDVLATVTPSKTTCAALGHHDTTGTCGCPSGGTFDYDFDELAGRASDGAPATLRLRFARCAAGGVVLDGEEFAAFQAGAVTARTAHLVVTGASSGSAASGASQDVVVWSAPASADVWARVAVSDGAIVVGTAAHAGSKDGAGDQIVVKDRRATWTCSVHDAEPQCTGPDGKEHAAKT